MRIAYVSFYDSRDIRGWSGTGYHIARCLTDQGVEILPVGPLRPQRAPVNVLRYLFNRHVLRKNDHPHRDPGFLKHYARQVHEKLAEIDADLVLGPGGLSLTRVSTDLPMAIWTDCTFASMVDYYAKFSNLSARTLRNGHDAERRVLERCDLVIMACQWAADSAINDYGVDPGRVVIAPFGANIESAPEEAEIDRLLEARPRDQCRLLFIGVDWERKGAATAVAVAGELNRRGLDTELTLVGCRPPSGVELPDFVRPLGFISKDTTAGRRQFTELFSDAHFFILPTQAECFGIVFSEANAFAVPALATRTGGVPTAVHDDVNGRLFDLSDPPSAYADYVCRLFDDFEAYDRLARSSYAEYRDRLNWEASMRKVLPRLQSMLEEPRRAAPPG